MPVGTAPIIKWRKFKYKIAPDDGMNYGNTTSACDAVEKSIWMAYGEVFKVRVKHARYEGSWDDSLDQGRRSEALARIALDVQEALNTGAVVYDLGIILPGGSRIFFPASPQRENVRTVYIKMKENYGIDDPAFTFEAVAALQPSSSNQDSPQTVAFLDLSPEIRNMIYKNILVNDEDLVLPERLPKRQPPMTLTCKEINKEILSLLWQKYGWFVCK